MTRRGFWRSTFSSLRVPNYRLYFTGQSVSLAGTWMQMTAQSWLAQEEGMNPTMLSRVVWRLEDAGLLARRPDPRDRRAALVDATPAGRKLHERIRAERADALSQLIEHLGVAEREDLDAALPVLEQLARDLKDRRP